LQVLFWDVDSYLSPIDRKGQAVPLDFGVGNHGIGDPQRHHPPAPDVLHGEAGRTNTSAHGDPLACEVNQDRNKSPEEYSSYAEKSGKSYEDDDTDDGERLRDEPHLENRIVCEPVIVI